jgi:hypothetical protein
MKRRVLSVIPILLIIFSFGGFKSTRTYRGAVDTSIKPGQFSLTTGLDFNTGGNFTVSDFEGFSDSKIYLFENPDLSDVINQNFLDQSFKSMPPFYHAAYAYPGYVAVSDNLLVDETEISNLAWQEFLFYMKRDSSFSYYKSLMPSKAQEPMEGYFENPFFRYYPIVGVSYDQVNEYCKWRNRILVRNFNYGDFDIRVRLPSEKEWELFASGGVDLKEYPFGVKSVKCKQQILKNTGGYFKIKNGLTIDSKDIDQEIDYFNKSKDSLVSFNCKQAVPYFLENKTPNYIYNLPVNVYGLYHVLGNVAELVLEKGVAKGGSYLHRSDECQIEKRVYYTIPAKNIGFRTVCEVIWKSAFK